MKPLAIACAIAGLLLSAAMAETESDSEDDSMVLSKGVLSAPASKSEELSDTAKQHPNWALDVEPAFMGSSVKILLSGARRSVFTPAIVSGKRLVPVHGLRFLLLDSLNEFISVAVRNAGPVLDGADTVELFDATGELSGFRIESDDPRLPSSLLSANFYKRYAATLGPKFVFLIPSRERVFVAKDDPKVLDHLKKDINAAYTDTEWPVSLEIFQYAPDGIRAVGVIGK